MDFNQIETFHSCTFQSCTVVNDVFHQFLYSLNLELRNNNAETALWLALRQLDSTYLSSENVSEYDSTFAARLIKRGANVDSVDTRTGNSIIHQAALDSKEAAAVFLVHHGALPNHKNTDGETPIHIAAKNGLQQLMGVLLQNGADPNLQTVLKPRPNAPSLSGSLSSMSSVSVRAEDSVVMSPSALGALSALSFATQVGG